MFIESIYLRNIPEEEVFPFTLPIIKSLEEPVDLTSNVTFFVGENGSGKSTLLEGMAAKLNLPAAGTAPVDIDPSLETARTLAKYLSLRQKTRSTRGFFSRAEDFIGFVRNIQSKIADLNSEIKEIEDTWTGGDITLALGAIKGEKQELIRRYGEDLDAMSHGEGFLKFFLARITGPGVYLIDEPESALSPQRQLSLMALIRKKVKEVNAQFIIATHSPIIMALPEAQILQFKEGKITQVKYKETDHYQLTKSFLDMPEVYLREL
ncbi:AAA family ATPase [Jiulongibacter sp. NS-SX5]|uniref:AAA family ATPase n=1 Tax=Jiulongibacter sp. NS-SX5 TaxID=3463854 RepID=UPI0040599923